MINHQLKAKSENQWVQLAAYKKTNSCIERAGKAEDQIPGLISKTAKHQRRPSPQPPKACQLKVRAMVGIEKDREMRWAIQSWLVVLCSIEFPNCSELCGHFETIGFAGLVELAFPVLSGMISDDILHLLGRNNSTNSWFDPTEMGNYIWFQLPSQLSLKRTPWAFHNWPP